MTDVQPDWKPPRRIKDAEAGREKIVREGRCRACGLVGRPYSEGGPINRAHVVPRGQRGDDIDENILPLCGSGTCGCHGVFDGSIPVATEPSLLKGRDREFVARRIALYPREIEAALNKKGQAWMDRRFAIPPRPTIE